MSVERWLPVAGFEGSYEVSSLGRVRSIDRLDSRGRRRRGVVLAPRVAARGHLTVALYDGTKREGAQIHRLVLAAFVGPCPAGMEGCHWNDVPADNRVENLRWDTRSSNVADSVRNGTHAMARRTHCPQGHAYTPSNTYYYPGKNRACRECRRIYRETHAEERRIKGRAYMRARRARENAARIQGRAAA